MTGAGRGGGGLSRVDLSGLALAEVEALRRLVAYYERRWDGESQTLFGLDRHEFQEVLAAWPRSLASGDPTAALAVNNSLALFVYGMPPPEHEVPGIIGITRTEAEDLYRRLGSRLRTVIDRGQG